MASSGSGRSGSQDPFHDGSGHDGSGSADVSWSADSWNGGSWNDGSGSEQGAAMGSVNQNQYGGQFGQDPFADGPPPQPFQPEPYEPDGYSSGFQSPDMSGQDGFADPVYGGEGAAVQETMPGGDAEPRFEASSQLALGDDDVRLPWLEGEDEDYEEEGSGVGQTVILVALALIAIGALVGGIFWLTGDRGKAPVVADGGVIRAPEGPYKVKPDEPGGEILSGSEDTSFAVAEGQSREPRISGDEEAPKPGFEGLTAAPAPAPKASSSAAATGGVGVQVGAYAAKDAAEAGWVTLKGQYEGLSGFSHRVVQGTAEFGTVYRLQAVAENRAAAISLCNGMKAARMSCQVM